MAGDADGKGDVSAIKPKAQTTRWRFIRSYDNARIRCGIVRNPSRKKLKTPRDVVRLNFVVHGEEIADWCMAENEALALSRALLQVVDELAHERELKRQRRIGRDYIGSVVRRASQKDTKATK